MKLLRPLRRLREHDRAIGEAVAEHGVASAERQAAVEELRSVLADLRQDSKPNGNGHVPCGQENDDGHS